MNTHKKTAGEYIGAYAPFILTALIGLIYHIKIQPMAGDDLYFADAAENSGLWAFLTMRYETWTSRIAIEFLLVFIIKHPLLWKILDTLLFAAFPVLLSDLFGQSRFMSWCAAAAVLLYPFHDMGSAGWITTTVNYFWPLFCGFYVCVLLKKALLRKKIHIYETAGGTVACLLASSHEQFAVILCVIFLLCAYYVFHIRRTSGEKSTPGSICVWKHAFTPACLATANFLSLILIILCPGNAARNAVSIADLPVFAAYSFADKLYLGLLGMERVFLANADAVFFVSAFLLSWLVCLKTDSYAKTLLCSLPLFILFGQTVVRTAYPGLSGIFVIPEQVLAWDPAALSTWLPMLYLLLTIISMFYAFCLLLKEKPFACFCLLLLLGCGFGAGMILGFMATIYVSGERVYIAFYFLLLAAVLYCMAGMEDTLQKKADTVCGRLALTIPALLCLINIGFVALSV